MKRGRQGKREREGQWRSGMRKRQRTGAIIKEWDISYKRSVWDLMRW